MGRWSRHGTPWLWRPHSTREPAAIIPLVAAGRVIPRVPTGWAPPGALPELHRVCQKTVSVSQRRPAGRPAGRRRRPQTALGPATRPRKRPSRIRGSDHLERRPRQSTVHSLQGAGHRPRRPRSGADTSAPPHPAPHLPAPTGGLRQPVRAVTESSAFVLTDRWLIVDHNPALMCLRAVSSSSGGGAR